MIEIVPTDLEGKTPNGIEFVNHARVLTNFMNPMNGMNCLFINIAPYNYEDLMESQLVRNEDELEDEDSEQDEHARVFDIVPAFENLKDTDYVVYGNTILKRIYGIYRYVKSTEIDTTVMGMIIDMLPVGENHFRFINNGGRFSVVRMGGRIHSFDDLFFFGGKDESTDDYPVQWDYEKAQDDSYKEN